MAIENMKTLNVRIKNKYDSYENWAASNLILEAGEIALCHTTVDVKVENGTVAHPALLMKVGDGTKTFANLPWLSAKAADVLAVCKDEDALTEFVNSVIADAGIASDDAMEALAGRVTTAEGKITTLEGKVTTAEGAITALQGLVGDTKVETQIANAINDLNLADTYAAKVHKHEIADVNGLETAIATAKKAGDDAAEALGEYKTLNDAAVKVNSDAIAAIKKDATITTFKGVEEALAGKQAAGDYATKAEAQGYANAKDAAIEAAHKAGTDAAAAAAQALVDAKAHTDAEMTRLVGDKTVGTQITEALASYTTTEGMNSAIATAKGEATAHADNLNTAMDARVKVVEGKAHEHTFVESELNLIQAGDVAKWNAAEQNAKDYADGLDGEMDTRVKALEAKFGEGEGNVESQIAAAVAAEAKLREEADADLLEQIESNDADILALQGLVGDTKVETQIANAVKEEADRAKGVEGGLETRLAAVEGDYLKAADKTELEGKIKSNADAITLLTNGVDSETVDGVNDLIAYVAEHGTEVTGMKADIKANADAIGKATEGETAGTGLYKRIEDAEAAIATKAAQADLEALEDRVEAVESDLNAENTGLKARMTAAEGEIDALQGLVGDKTVAEQIEAVKTDTSNKDAVVLAEAQKAIAAHADNGDIHVTAEQKTTWNAAVQTVTAAADSGLKAVKTGNDVAIEINEDLVWVFDCGGAV